MRRPKHPAPFIPTLRRLFLVKAVDGLHMCLVPFDTAVEPEPVAGRFTCPCGAEFDAVWEPLSYSNEYEPRCLRAAHGFRDERKVPG